MEWLEYLWGWTRLVSSWTDWHRVGWTERSAKRCHMLSAQLIGRVSLLMLGHAHIVQPPTNTLKHRWEVYRPKHQCGQIKSQPTNISWMQEDGNTYLTHINTIYLTWRPKKDVRRSDKLTIKYRKQGEPWHDDREYGWSPVGVAISVSKHMPASHDLPNQAMMQMSHKVNKPSHSTSLKFHSNQTHLFATFICIQLSTIF